ncbi:ribokinase [soil metagenome]
MFDVCVVGSANLDRFATTAVFPRPGETVLGSAYAEHAGGKGLNQAIAAARAGAHTAFVGAVGDDAVGDRLLDELAAAGVDLSSTRRFAAPTGRALVFVDKAGENSIVVVPGANALLEIGALPPSAVVLVQLEIPWSTVSASLEIGRRAGATTILNPAPAPTGRQHGNGALGADIVVPNEHEAAALGGAAALLAGGAGAVITTAGAAGVQVVAGDDAWHQAAFPTEAVDTTAAGDAFCGALAARVAAGDDLHAAVRFAAAAGALATTTRGAVPSLPHADAIEALLAR